MGTSLHGSRFTLLFGIAIAGGCQSYRAAPLHLRSHAAAWASRDPASMPVGAFARQLAADTGEPDTAFDPADGFSLREAEAVALFFNPQLRAARLKARVPVVAAGEAGRWPDPVLQIDAERIVQSVEHPWVIGGLLNVTLPLSGRLALERDQAVAQADVARVNAILEEQRVLSELRLAWAELWVLEHRIELTRAFVADLDGIVTQAETLRQAGELDPLEAGLFRLEQARRRAELRSLEPQRREQGIAVRSLLGLVPDAPVRLVPSPPSARIADNLATRRQAVEANHPRLRLAQAEYEVAERTLALEVRRQYPDLTLGGGYGRDEGTNRVLGGLDIPIPIFNANRQAIAEARANRDAARAAAEATYEELIGKLARAEAAIEAANVRREALEREVAPLADEQLRSARELGRLGAVNPLVIFEAMTRAHETRLEVLEAAGREAAARKQLDALLRPVLGVEPDVKVNR